MNILTTLQSYMVYPFVRHALIAGVLIALCSSLLGVTLVLKRFSYIGDGLSHVAFGAMAVATVVSVSNNMVIVMPVTIISAILLLSQNSATNIRGDAALAMISVGALAFGYLVLNVFSKSANLSGDVCSTLFGSTSILTLKAVLTLEHFDPTDQRVVVTVGHFAVISEISKLHQAFLEFNHIVAAIAALQRAIIHNAGVCIFLNRQKTGHGIAGFNAIGNLAPFFAAFQYRHIGASGDFIQLSGVSARLLTDFQRAFFRRHDGDNRLYFRTSAV